MEFADEFVGSGLERAYEDGDRFAATDNFLDMELFALEFLPRPVLILDDELDALAGGNDQRVGLERVILDDEGKFGLGCPSNDGCRCKYSESEKSGFPIHGHRHFDCYQFSLLVFGMETAIATDHAPARAGDICRMPTDFSVKSKIGVVASRLKARLIGGSAFFLTIGVQGPAIRIFSGFTVGPDTTRWSNMQ